jgi:hypothetical protein
MKKNILRAKQQNDYRETFRISFSFFKRTDGLKEKNCETETPLSFASCFLLPIEEKMSEKLKNC